MSYVKEHAKNIKDIGRPKTIFYHEKSFLLNTRKSGKNWEYKARHPKNLSDTQDKKEQKTKKEVQQTRVEPGPEPSSNGLLRLDSDPIHKLIHIQK